MEEDDTDAVDEVLMRSVGIKLNFSPVSEISGFLTTPAVLCFHRAEATGGNE